MECHREYVTALKEGRAGSLFVDHERAKSFRAEPETFFRPLAGKNLACWCDLDMPCHADTLITMANPKCEEVKS